MSELAASDVSNKSNGSKVSASPATSGSTDAVRVLDAEMNWLAMLLDAAIRLYFGQPCEVDDIARIPAPELRDETTWYAQIVREHATELDERVTLALALAPYLRPQLLDPLFARNPNLERAFSEFGGTSRGAHVGFWPTYETAAFVIGGGLALERRINLTRLADASHPLREARILHLEQAEHVSNWFAAPLQVDPLALSRITSGVERRPEYSNTFPARRLSTPLDWSDLVLQAGVRAEVDELRAWIEHSATLLDTWQLDRHIKPGYRSLFYGPPGTGKTLTASLLGKTTGLDVYRIDLSLVVSKFIGETEKNLAQVFDEAEKREWILFFDEADALFGKRTATSSANDRYANQEVAYLLQRVEDFPGVVILASNLKGNIDDAFARRFQSMIYFPSPGPVERLTLWRNAFSRGPGLAADVDLERIAAAYEVTGGAIVNVLRHAALATLRRSGETIAQADIIEGIRREFRKDGKTP
ncbi:MAG: ATP-binding protein [Paraburkholderia sp.]|uniref:ATP-binding protein n=1 Tax=Burkholderiaceae TaxID=119060 RepID=UPI0010F637D8|nr:ATP-binding protein [Burkholderia sp. 4M9327F10]